MYAYILLPLSLQEEYLYKIPKHLLKEAKIGMRCLVQFGSKHFYVGIICKLSDNIPPSSQINSIKEILSIPDKDPIVSHEEILFWEWIALYYMCTTGDVLRAALPSSLIPESNTIVHFHPEILSEDILFSPKEALFLDKCNFINQKKTPLKKLFNNTSFHNKFQLFNSLLQKGAFSIDEGIKNMEKQIGTAYFCFDKQWQDEERIETLLNGKLRRQNARLKLVEQLLFLQEEKGGDFKTLISEKELNPNGEAAKKAIIRLLLKDKILTKEFLQTPISSFSANPSYISTAYPLKENSPNYFIAKNYIEELTTIGEQIKTFLHKGKRVLLLLPKSTGLEGEVDILKSQLGLTNEPIFLYTSNISLKEKQALRYRMIENNEPLLIIGSRTASFIPSNNLGLIIIAEEQDPFYKQDDPAPRYNARNTLIYRALQLKIPILLTSVTPSLESFYNIHIDKKYNLIEAKKSNSFAKISLVDIEKEIQIKRQKYGNIISYPIKEKLSKNIQNGEKAIILSARRGFSPILYCKSCDNSLKCSQCNISLTLHKNTNTLVCHYCGEKLYIPSQCPFCKKTILQDDSLSSLKAIGFGTERIEEELKELFPQIDIIRIDADTIKSKKDRINTRKKILANNSNSFFVGTQQIVHFSPLENIKTIAITEIDRMLSSSNFRSDEEVFSMIYQLAVKYPNAEILIQTRDCEKPLLEYLSSKIEQGFENYYQALLVQREFTQFPPYTRIIEVYIKSQKESDVVFLAMLLSKKFKENPSLFENVSTPIKPYPDKVRMLFIRHIILRVHPSASLYETRLFIKQTVAKTQTQSIEARRSKIFFNTDI